MIFNRVRSFTALMLAVVALAVLGQTASPTASPTRTSPLTPPSLDDNPYIELYNLRVKEAEAALHRQEALGNLAARKLDRGRRMRVENSIAPEEFDQLVSELAVSAADVELARKKVGEAKAYLRIVEALVKRGVSIPLCTYEMD